MRYARDGQCRGCLRAAPARLNFFFDNNLPAQLARGLRELSRNDPKVGQVIHLTDRFPAMVKDLTWIPALSEDSVPWYVISMDKFKKDHRAEREAIRRAGHTVYVLDPQWSGPGFWPKAARWVLWWPHVVQHASRTSGGVYRVPWRHTSQSRFQAMA
jgi:hypothetical protein